jgi:predicted neuraminidase
MDRLKIIAGKTKQRPAMMRRTKKAIAVIFVCSLLFVMMMILMNGVSNNEGNFQTSSSTSSNDNEQTKKIRRNEIRARRRRSSELSQSASSMIERAEEFIEDTDEVFRTLKERILRSKSSRSSSSDEEEEDVLVDDLDEVEIGKPIIDDDIFEQEQRDLENVNTIDETEFKEEEGADGGADDSDDDDTKAQAKYKDKRMREVCESDDEVALRTKSLRRTERNRIEQIKPRKFWVAKDEVANGRKYSHMATIGRYVVNETKKGFAVAWQSSSGIEGIKGQSIMISFAEDIDRQWTKPKRVESMMNVKTAVWSPVLFNPPKEPNALWLFYTESQNCLRPARENKSGSKIPPRYSPGGDVKVTKSMDGGKTWSEPQEVHAQSKEDSPGMPKVIANRITVHSQTGNWILPYWKEKAEPNACRQPKTPASHGVLISKDNGKTWQPKGKIRVGGTWLIEGAVVERRDYSLQLFFRTSKGKVYTAFSWDGGDTWTGANPTTIPNPDSKMDATSFPDTREIVVAFNDATDRNKINKGRCRLRVSISCDGGVGFKTISELEEGSLKMYIHYPTVITDGDRAIVAYSLMGHPHLRQGDIGGIKIAEVKLNRPSFKKYVPSTAAVTVKKSDDEEIDAQR